MSSNKKKKKYEPDAATRAANRALVQDMEARDPNGQWSQGGQGYTVNSTNDPKAPDGYYVSIRDESTGNHTTAVYNSDDTFADTKANEQWRDA